MIKELINQVIEGRDLTQAEAETAVREIMEGGASAAQIAAFLVGLRIKGETVDEITGAARVMREKATRVTTRHPRLVDTCGTGGDGARTFNISTAAALVVAGAGQPVAKHGNRSVSSLCGSADVLEALGVRVDQSPERVGRAIDELGIGFLFAPSLHGAMKHAAGPRREIGARTIFNLLGPLTNPAGAQVQVLGVFSPALTDKLGEVLANLGTRGALVVHGDGGIDELSVSGPTRVTEVRGAAVRTYEVTPEQCGVPRSPAEAIRGGTPAQNAAIIRGVLQGEPGPARDVVTLNAAAALYAAERAESLAEGVEAAARSIDSGAALHKLEGLLSFTQAAAAS